MATLPFSTCPHRSPARCEAHISSNSWGGHTESVALQTAIQVAMEAGHLFVAWMRCAW